MDDIIHSQTWDPSATLEGLELDQLSSRYVQVGDLVFFQLQGRVSAIPTPGAISFELPVKPHKSQIGRPGIASWTAQDVSAGTIFTGIGAIDGSDGITLSGRQTSASGEVNAFWSTSADRPFVWAAGADRLIVWGVYISV